MKFVSGITQNERRLVCGIQKAIGAYEDNSIGPVTLVDLAIALGIDDIFPLCVDMYGAHVMVCKDFLPAAVAAPLKNYARAISGSFSWAGKPCSILISGGIVKYGTACHYWTLDTPESVIYKRNDGHVEVRRAKTADDLPDNIRYAVGGMGLLQFYDPTAEGFTGDYSDVLRKTDHTAIGYKNGYFFLCYLPRMFATDVNNFCKKMKFEYAIMLDGGGPAAINNEDIKINEFRTQYYIVQAI